jgi:hypothetical protein
MMRAAKTAIVIAAALAFFIGAVMVFIAFQHNPQGETFDQQSGAIHYGYVAALFASWFLSVFTLVTAVEGALYLLIRIIKAMRVTT